MKNFFFSIWIFLARTVVYLYLASGLYVLWSRIYRFIWERQYDNVPISRYSRLQDLVNFIAHQKWKADSWKQLFDAVSTPNKIQAVGQDKEGDHYIGDCDDFAVYISNAIELSLEAGLMKEDQISNPQMLTVVWINRDTGHFNGHVVCLLEIKNKAFPAYAYMDYHHPSDAMDSVEKVVDQVLKHYGHDAECLVWSTSKPDLTGLKARFGLSL